MKAALADVFASLLDHRCYRRPAASHTVIPELDGLRSIAIAAVFLCHIPSTLLRHRELAYELSPLEHAGVRLVGFGGTGVLLFFVISGFVVAMPFARKHLAAGPAVSLRDYFLRRLIRIEPPYIVNLLLCTALLALAHKYDAAILSSRLLASLGYAHEAVFCDHSWINRVTWSLEVEVQFYLLAPLLSGVFALPTLLRRSVLIVGILGVSWLAHLLPANPEWLLKYLQFFLAGFLLLDLYLTGVLRAALPRLGWSAILLVVAAFLVNAVHPEVATFILPWAMFSLGLAALCTARFRSWLARPWIAAIGAMCYTIYLYHGVIISALVQTIFRAGERRIAIDSLVLLAIALPLTAAVSIVAYRALERPCIQAAARFAGRGPR